MNKEDSDAHRHGQDSDRDRERHFSDVATSVMTISKLQWLRN